MKIESERIQLFRDTDFLVFSYDWPPLEFPKTHPYGGPNPADVSYREFMQAQEKAKRPPFPLLFKDLVEMDLFEVCLAEGWQDYQAERSIGWLWTFAGGEQIWIAQNMLVVPGAMIQTQEQYDEYLENLHMLFRKVQENANNS